MTHQKLECDKSRWLEAQRWELDLWQRGDRRKLSFQKRLTLWLKRLVRANRGEWPDDWNLWWRDKFQGYRFIPPSLENALELGCGPFTNMRLVLEGRKINAVYCSDPLAREYARFKNGWLAWAFRKGLVHIDDHPAEQVPFDSDHFELVVMINVLDHVHDAVKCIEEAIRVTGPGGLLIIGQDLTGEEDVARWPDLKDIGHPISIHHSTLDKLLLPGFSPVIHKILRREEGRNPDHHYGTYVFAGKKKTA